MTTRESPANTRTNPFLQNLTFSLPCTKRDVSFLDLALCLTTYQAESGSPHTFPLGRSALTSSLLVYGT